MSGDPHPAPAGLPAPSRLDGGVPGLPGSAQAGPLRDELHDLLLAHQRLGISVCGCGGMRLGESYPHHLIDALLDGPLRQFIAD